MGIRFACHVCDKRLNVKHDLAGRRGICPSCSARFRIPLEDAEKSTPVEAKEVVNAGTAVASVQNVAANNAKRNDPVLENASVGEGPFENRETENGATENRETGNGAIGNVGVQSQEESIGPNHSVALLDEEPDATWYVRPPSGGQYGPATGEVLKQWIAEGRVAATALLWRDGWPQWRDASEVLPELATRLPQGSVATKSYVPAPATQPTASAGRAVAGASSESQFSKSDARISGQSDLGADRRARSMRRVMLIGVLSAVAVTLVGILFIIVNR